jgi:predicted RNA polymerase sigma factor
MTCNWVTETVYEEALNRLRRRRVPRDLAADALHDAVVVALRSPPPAEVVRHPALYLAQLALWRMLSARRHEAREGRAREALADPSLAHRRGASPHEVLVASRALERVAPLFLRRIAESIVAEPERGSNARCRTKRALDHVAAVA